MNCFLDLISLIKPGKFYMAKTGNPYLGIIWTKLKEKGSCSYDLPNSIWNHIFFCNITCAKKTEENKKNRVDRRKMAGRKIRRGCLVMISDNFWQVYLGKNLYNFMFTFRKNDSKCGFYTKKGIHDDSLFVLSRCNQVCSLNHI